MSLTIRKVIVFCVIGVIFLMANILVIANWLTYAGVAEKADWVRREFLTGTAIAVIAALLILLVNPVGRVRARGRTCPVCDAGVSRAANYCGECGSRMNG